MVQSTLKWCHILWSSIYDCVCTYVHIHVVLSMAALLFCSGQLYFWFWEANWSAVMLTSAWAVGWQVPLFFCLDHFPKQPTLQGSLGSLDLSDFLLCVFCGYMHMVMHGQHIILYFTIYAHGWHWVTMHIIIIVIESYNWSHHTIDQSIRYY